MNIQIGHAVMDELGKTIGAMPGDQTGKEIAIGTWYAKNKSGRVWNHVVTEMSKSMGIASFHDLKNEILNTQFDKIVEKCHLGAHKSTLNLVPSDINEVGKKASLFLIIANELLNNPNINWGKNGQPYEITVK